MAIKGTLVGLLVFGLILAGLPIAAGTFSSSGIGFANFLWMIPGIIFMFVSIIGLIFSSLYVRARGNLAFVRTGQGGRKVIMDKGAIVVGFLHEIIPVSLETMKIVVERKAKESLITLDKLRASVVAEFYIRVKADDEGIATAARTLGDKVSSSGKRMDSEELRQGYESAINKLEREKLIDALRTVAAKSNLEDLNLKRDEFKKHVMDVVRNGLKENGLELEDCTISSLDQAMDVLDENNIFDAQGLRNLQEVISAQSIKTNEFKRTAELAIKKKDIETEKAILEQKQDIAFKTADQEREVRVYKAEQDKKAREAEIANEETVGRRAIEKDQAIKVAGVKSDEEVATKEVLKAQAIATANVAKVKAVEVAQRDQEIAIAQKEAERAAAEAKKQEAEALAEKARQDVTTVQVTESANREKTKKIIDQQAQSERDLIEAQKKADAKAYEVTRKAEADKEAAEADLIAKTKAAEADLVTKAKAAEGSKLQQMVPIEVSAKQVEVDKTRVETVLKPELAAKSEHAQVSIELTLNQARIEADKEVGIALAKAFGDMMSKASMNIYGDPETLAKMSGSFLNGHGLAQKIDGFMQSADGIKSLLPALAPLAKKVGINLPDADDSTELPPNKK